ncbi:M23 family metallopeptidase [Nocardioides sp. CFH 31398]|uniref:peptidoglycan DD-metalloendopeptidase family protein n=1 Tax=Nocardioides sp. CFH 31398 TaxID=2919579 RepID=UPI001F05559A|nr:M23 family metallopeptidase [Nocardioides sp. CFH 31398]MCH1867115.1 peptidoglycan DD-metalloendopeptidase family protein [Nocardioides sp. CFH 31398]
MRSLPRTARRPAIALAAAAALLLGASLTYTAAAEPDDLRQRADRLEDRIDDADSALSESSARAHRAVTRLRAAQDDLKDARARLDEVQDELAEAKRQDERMADRLQQARDELAEARDALAAGQADVEDQRLAVADTVVDLYTGADPGLAAFASMLNAEDPADLTRRDEATDVLVGDEARAYDDLRAAEVLLSVDEDAVEAAKELVAERREAAADNLARKKDLTAEQWQVTTEVNGLVTERSRARQAADRARAADRRTLRELEAESDRVEELLRRRAMAAGAGAGRAPAGGGVLGYPVDGYVTSPFGMRTHPIYGYRALHDGTDFGAPCGSPMYAGAAGTVVDSYFSTSYGNRLILDHGLTNGVGLASIFNHATSYVVSPGQRVAKGQLIGYVGSTGWSTGCHLHFTVTVNGTPVNPMDWL